MRATPASIQYSVFRIQNVDFLVFLLMLLQPKRFMLTIGGKEGSMTVFSIQYSGFRIQNSECGSSCFF